MLLAWTSALWDTCSFTQPLGNVSAKDRDVILYHLPKIPMALRGKDTFPSCWFIAIEHY